ncbi:major facilitator superfamily domain-containing protein [Mycena filopes]|nr:major facilitator superfamily domain-containing protein [Mycena filopes]
MQAALVEEGVSSVSTLRTALLGISLLGLGELLSGFSMGNIGALFVTSGLITGVGTRCTIIFVVSVIPGQYFSRRRGLANGIVYAGGGLGGAVTSFVLDALLQSVGVAWSFRILGLVTLVTGIPAAWLIKERTTIRTTGFIEWSLFRDLRFVILFLAGAIGTFPLFVPPFFLPLYSSSVGLSASTGAGLVAGFNFSSALGRLGFGYATDLIGPINVLFIALLLSAVSMLAIWPVSTSLTPLILFVVINGAANGGFFSTMPTVVGAVFGSARVSVAMGMIVTGWAGGYFMGAPIAGYLLNAYGGPDSTLSAYHPAMFYAGSMALGSAGLIFLMRLKTSTSLFKKV